MQMLCRCCRAKITSQRWMTCGAVAETAGPRGNQELAQPHVPRRSTGARSLRSHLLGPPELRVSGGVHIRRLTLALKHRVELGKGIAQKEALLLLRRRVHRAAFEPGSRALQLEASALRAVLPPVAEQFIKTSRNTRPHTKIRSLYKSLGLYKLFSL